MRIKDEHNPLKEIFDSASIYFEKDPEKNLRFIKKIERRLTEKLRMKGYLKLSEAYGYLNINCTSSHRFPDAGWVVGYTDDFVNFGLYDIHQEGNMDFINGYVNEVYLRPNCCMNIKMIRGNVL